MENKPKQIVMLTATLGLLTSMAPLIAGAAEEGEATAVELPAYVVVATRTPLSLDRVSPSVSQISEEDLEFFQDRSLSDALKREPGLVLAESGAMGAQTSLFTRGTESNHTAFFMDGRRLSSAFSNQYDLEFLSVDNLSSVQMQRGASSVNYGSSGIGGVVDLRIKSGLEEAQSGGAIEAEIGSNDYRRGAVSAHVAEGDFGFSVAASKLSTDNERDNDEFEVESVTTRADYRLTDAWSLELIGKFSEADKELPGDEITPKLEDSQNTQNWLISPGLRYATDTLSMHLFYSRSKTETTLEQIRSSYDDFWTYLGDYPSSNVIEVESDELSLQFDYSVSDDILLTSGFVYRRDDASNSNLEYDPLESVIPYDEEFNQIGGFAQLLWILGDFELRGGLRYDDYSEYDSEMTGSLEVVYYLDNIGAAVFVKYATSYAPPSASDIAYDLPAYDTPLEAEKAESYEVGFKQTLLEGDFQWSVVAFRNEIEDMLGYDVIEVASYTYEYDSINVESAVTEGVELSASYALTSKANIAASYTYLTAIDEASDTRLLRRPRHMVQASADYAFTESFSTGVQMTGYFAREDFDPSTYVQANAEDFVVVRLVADWQLNDTWSIFARVENLLDEEYSSVAGYPALGRAGYLGVRFEF
jgi:vitamin B12 transporter